jgi:hypothetical protein
MMLPINNIVNNERACMEKKSSKHATNETVGKAFLLTIGRLNLHNLATFIRCFDFFYSHNSGSQ